MIHLRPPIQKKIKKRDQKEHDMKKFCLCLMMCLGQLSWAGAESWTVWTRGPDGGVRETYWEVREDGSAEEKPMAFFLKGQMEPLYTVHRGAKETRIVFSSGMIRRFAPGPMAVTDLPMPVVVSFAALNDDMRQICAEEYTGGAVFRACVDIVQVNSLEEADSLPDPLPGQMVLVRDGQGFKALIGSDFRAERQ